jgi:hypothetical protein
VFIMRMVAELTKTISNASCCKGAFLLSCQLFTLALSAHRQKEECHQLYQRKRGSHDDQWCGQMKQ